MHACAPCTPCASCPCLCPLWPLPLCTSCTPEPDLRLRLSETETGSTWMGGDVAGDNLFSCLWRLHWLRARGRGQGEHGGGGGGKRQARIRGRWGRGANVGDLGYFLDIHMSSMCPKQRQTGRTSTHTYPPACPPPAVSLCPGTAV